MAEALAKHRMFTCLTKHYSVEDLVRFYTDKANADIIPFTIYSMGANQQDFDKFLSVLAGIETQDSDLDAQTEPKIVCVDVANGYTSDFITFIHCFKISYPNKILIAGNVCTPEKTYGLLKAGADFVKVGVGPGSVCTTRIVTGVGYPQLSAVLECAQAALDANGAIIADGGCTSPGDVAKAFAAGASAVMLGGMLAGHDEGYEGRLEPGYFGHPTTTGKVKFYGMASKVAQELHNGGVSDYRSSEGREVTVLYRGPVENTVLHLLGGLRSACAYTGASTLSGLQNANFVKVNHQYNGVFTNG